MRLIFNGLNKLKTFISLISLSYTLGARTNNFIGDSIYPVPAYDIHVCSICLGDNINTPGVGEWRGESV